MSRSKLRRALLVTAGVVLVLAVAAFLPVTVGVTQIRSEADIARTPHEVFEYVTTPANWPRWHPSSIAVQGDSHHSLAVGETVVEEFRVAGRHGFATWRAVSHEPDRLWKIEGEIDGRIAGSVTYTLSPTSNGTHFLRNFEYPSPTILFAVANALVLRSRISDESNQAVTNLKTLLDSRTETH